ncbi:hypothetical protein M431DRAFT_550959 [Trichoderma harzianum CBS 226.95]|uniref:Uncharacterized protein n=1 Tax=Trichoderma harzianum CBS 226.95 TaxID=983964 RepID=A0A2T4AI81_TRIHA|nr:hypothetical protein M431DRAFT_550959 [Trichoderma harzianum CBS 226.95]PTB56800.1 hypothetical protein M431DRAFT_550959 [Trichoderma harzianum CBS 226.95]
MLSPYLASATSVSVCCSDGVSLCYTLCYTLCHRTCLKFSLSVGVCSRALLLANNFPSCVSFSLPSSAMWERLQSFINNKDHCRLSVFLQSDWPTPSATPAQVSQREAEMEGLSTHLPLLVSVIHFCCLSSAFDMITKISIFYNHRIGSPESVPIARPLCCTGSGSQHREFAVLSDGERLPIREISW